MNNYKFRGKTHKQKRYFVNVGEKVLMIMPFKPSDFMVDVVIFNNLGTVDGFDYKNHKYIKFPNELCRKTKIPIQRAMEFKMLNNNKNFITLKKGIHKEEILCDSYPELLEDK